MGIKDIEEKLYKQGGETKKPQLGETEFDPLLGKTQTGFQKEDDLWEAKQKGLTKESKKGIKIALIALGVITVIALGIYGSYKYRQTSFSEERTKIFVEGPGEAKSGKYLTYEIRYENQNRADLENAVLRITFPDNFKPEANPDFKIEGPTSGVYDLGVVKGKTSGKAYLNGRAYSPRGALMYIKAELVYVPEVFNSTFVAKEQLGVSITSTPIALEIEVPKNVSSGDSVNYLISYKNTGEEDFENIRIRADYPSGFIFSKSEPRTLEGNNTWYVGHLSTGQEGKIVVSGKIEGHRDEVKKVRVYVGAYENDNFVSYNDEQMDTKIVASPLTIVQKINDKSEYIANAGDTLRFAMEYKNESDISLRDVIVTEVLDSPVLDYSTLDLKGGFYDSKTKTITWKASDYPELKVLAPGKSGKINFSVEVKEILPVDSEDDKNFVISGLAKIDSPDVPTPIEMNKVIAGNRVDIKVNTKVLLETKGYYNDLMIPNSGPTPPKVGAETTYTLHWILKNVSNDATGAVVEASLPAGVVATGKVFPENAKLTYNERSNSMVWNVGTLKAGTGFSSVPQEVAFQVRINPSVDQTGKELDILGPTSFKAKDAFTGIDLAVIVEKKRTSLPEDTQLVGGQMVAP